MKLLTKPLYYNIRTLFWFYEGRLILKSTSDIPWKYIELIFSNTLSPITQCSSASPSVLETCK